MGEIWLILPLTCGETATFHAKFCERPLLSVMNVGTAALAGLQKFKLLARDLTLAPAPDCRLYRRDFNQMNTRTRPEAGILDCCSITVIRRTEFSIAVIRPKKSGNACGGLLCSVSNQ
jgi:hypothetical protein